MMAPVRADPDAELQERYTVVYEGDPDGLKILSGERALGRAVTVIVGAQWEEVRTLRAERDQLAADLHEAREDDWSTDFTAASGLPGGILAGAYTRSGHWRQAVVSYAGQIFWDWPFGETPTHWRRLAKPPALTPDPHQAAGSASGKEKTDERGS